MCGLGDGAVAAIRARVDGLPATDSSERTLRTALLHARLALYASTGSAGELETLLVDPSEPARAPVGPPATLRTEELLGAARLKAGRPQEAVAAYERALRLTPTGARPCWVSRGHALPPATSAERPMRIGSCSPTGTVRIQTCPRSRK